MVEGRTLAEWRAVLDLYLRKIAHGRNSGLAFPDELAGWEFIAFNVCILIADLERREAAGLTSAA